MLLLLLLLLRWWHGLSIIIIKGLGSDSFTQIGKLFALRVGEVGMLRHERVE